MPAVLFTCPRWNARADCPVTFDCPHVSPAGVFFVARTSRLRYSYVRSVVDVSPLTSARQKVQRAAARHAAFFRLTCYFAHLQVAPDRPAC